MSFKVALNAGHYLGTAGKNCPKSLDPNMTKEWVLNNRVVTKMQKLLEPYKDIEVLRVDDPEGLVNQSFTQKRKIVNDFGADFYLGVHHNAAGKTFDGGGISAFVTINPTAESVAWRDELYAEAVKDTGLKGNRASPLVERDLYELRYLNCPAVLMECGFMDSRIDCPIILTEEYADKIAKAFVAVIVRKAGVKDTPVEKPQESPTKRVTLVTINLPVLMRGSNSEAVRTLQMLLNALGYHDAEEKPLAVDGSFGPATLYALKSFQNAQGLDIDGYCGQKTWTALLT